MLGRRIQDTEIKQRVDALVRDARGTGLSAGDVIRELRKAEAESIRAQEAASLAGAIPKLPRQQWESLKDAVRLPVAGEPSLGTVYRELSSALATDDQDAFWVAALSAVRELRRHIGVRDDAFGKGR